MKRYSKKRVTGRWTALLLTLVLALVYIPQFSCSLFAGETEYPEETVAFLVNDDGTETAIDREELEELREGSIPELPETIEVVTDESDSGWLGDMDTGAIEFFTEPDVPEIPTEEAAGTDESLAGENITESADETTNETASPENEADPEGIITDDSSDGEEETETEPAGASGALIMGSGDSEHIHIPALLGKSVDLSSPMEEALVEGSAGIEGRNLEGGSSSSFANVIGGGYFNVDITQNGSTVTVSGSIQAPYSFYGLFVDTTPVEAVFGYSVDSRINMNAFETGYHTVCLGVIQGGVPTLVDLIGKKYMVSNQLERPGYNGVFTVYSNYFTYYPYNMALQNQAHNLYMEYSSNKGKTWTRSGYMRANMIQLYISQAYTISGLKPKTKYLTRILYGTNVTYSTDYDGDGMSHFFGGPPLNTTTIKTGAAKKPSIKSITAKAVNVRYHQIRHYGKYTGVYLYTERFYTCKIKVTVRLRKKPGTKGLWINGKWVRGNKKVYTKTFSPYPNYYARRPRGHYKFSVSVCSGQSSSWGGYSPSVSKRKTLS